MRVLSTKAQRCASGAGSSRSDAGAEAVPRRLQAVVRLDVHGLLAVHEEHGQTSSLPILLPSFYGCAITI